MKCLYLNANSVDPDQMLRLHCLPMSLLRELGLNG